MAGFSAAAAFKDAFVTMAQTLNAGSAVQVVFGHPGMSQVEDIISIGDVQATQEVATMGTNRSREESLQLTVTISCFRFGGVEMEKVASDRAYELLAAIEQQVRVTDTTVGGTVRQCFLTSHASEGATSPDVIAQGRLIDVVAIFSAQARISS